MNANEIVDAYESFDPMEDKGTPHPPLTKEERKELAQCLFGRLVEDCHWTHTAMEAFAWLHAVERFWETGQWEFVRGVHSHCIALDEHAINSNCIVHEIIGDTYAECLLMGEDCVFRYSSIGDEIEAYERERYEEDGETRCGYCGEFTEIKTEDWSDTLCEHCGRFVHDASKLPDGVCAYYVNGNLLTVHDSNLEIPVNELPPGMRKVLGERLPELLGSGLRGEVWIDSLSLLPDDTVGDVLDRIDAEPA